MAGHAPPGGPACCVCSPQSFQGEGQCNGMEVDELRDPINARASSEVVDIDQLGKSARLRRSLSRNFRVTERGLYYPWGRGGWGSPALLVKKAGGKTTELWQTAARLIPSPYRGQWRFQSWRQSTPDEGYVVHQVGRCVLGH